MSYVISQRTREIGIRIALGEPPRAVLQRVVRESALITAAGLALGCALSLALSRALAALLYGIAPTDAPTYIGISLLLMVVAILASYAPARRATRIDPLAALRA
jgi:putative ABC transport system permease protein